MEYLIVSLHKWVDPSFVNNPGCHVQAQLFHKAAGSITTIILGLARIIIFGSCYFMENFLEKNTAGTDYVCYLDRRISGLTVFPKHPVFVTILFGAASIIMTTHKVLPSYRLQTSRMQNCWCLLSPLCQIASAFLMNAVVYLCFFTVIMEGLFHVFAGYHQNVRFYSYMLNDYAFLVAYYVITNAFLKFFFYAHFALQRVRHYKPILILSIVLAFASAVLEVVVLLKLFPYDIVYMVAWFAWAT